MLKKTAFIYDDYFDCDLCPEGQVLDYATTSRDSYREYKSNAETCLACPLFRECTPSRKHVKVVTFHLWEGYKEQIIEHRYEERGKRIYKRRKETVERSFADAKELHGHRYARLRGITKVTEQSLLAAACQNMKKIALLLDREGPTATRLRTYRTCTTEYAPI